MSDGTQATDLETWRERARERGWYADIGGDWWDGENLRLIHHDSDGWEWREKGRSKWIPAPDEATALQRALEADEPPKTLAESVHDEHRSWLLRILGLPADSQHEVGNLRARVETALRTPVVQDPGGAEYVGIAEHRRLVEAATGQITRIRDRQAKILADISDITGERAANLDLLVESVRALRSDVTRLAAESQAKEAEIAGLREALADVNENSVERQDHYRQKAATLARMLAEALEASRG